MFQKTKLKKGYLSAIGMSLVLLLVNTLGLLLGTGVGQISPPSSDGWENYATSYEYKDGAYYINSAGALACLLQGTMSNATVRLEADIDLGAHTWSGIQSGKVSNFDGQGHTISNLNGTSGLFYAVSGNVSNLTLSNVNIFNSSSPVGAVANVVDYNSRYVKIDNIEVTSGCITSGNPSACGAGGILGGVSASGSAIISNCINNATVKMFKESSSSGQGGFIGGIAGFASSSELKNCINTGDVIGNGFYVGGISGYDGKIYDSYAECNVTGSGRVGGVVGGSGNITNSGFNGNIYVNSGTNEGIGSIGGSNAVTNCCYGVANIYIADASIVNEFGTSASNIKSTYSFSRIITPTQTIEKRKYKTGADETAPFSEMAVHKNINGGYPFPKSLFAVGQFIDSDVMGYLEEYGFSKFNYPLYKKGNHYYVELGEYPQTYVGDSLNATLKSWYTSNNPSSVDSYTNDLGTSADTITHYAYSYNGNKYVRVVSAIVYSSSGYKTQDEATTLMPSQEYWFKVEPIKWWVLNYTDVQNGANPIVLAEQALTANVTWNKSTSDQNLWASKSNIRTWLNSTFYNDAFSEVKDDIQTTAVKNNSSSSYTDGSGTSTQDNVWLLSYGEAGGGTAGQYSENRYFNDNPSRLCSPTDYALVNNCFMNVNASYPTEIRKNGGSCNWWLRSASTSSTTFAQYVNYSGNLYYGSVNFSATAVRPALTLAI